MRKYLTFFFSLLFTFSGLYSCYPPKVVRKANQIEVTTRPCPIEMQAKKVPIDISIAFPKEYFSKKLKLILIPTLISNNGGKEVCFRVQTLIGERIGGNYQRISYKTGTLIDYKGIDTGANFRFRDTIPYDEDLRNSKLVLRIIAVDYKGESVPVTVIKVCEGIITTPELVLKGLVVDSEIPHSNLALGKNIIKSIAKPSNKTLTKSAKIYYDFKKSKIEASEMRKPEIDSLISLIKEINSDKYMELQDVKISSTVSPDETNGSIESESHQLTYARQTSAGAALEKGIKSIKINGLEEFTAQYSKLGYYGTAFEDAITNSKLTDREVLLKVLKMYPSSDHQRLHEIKKLGDAFKEIRDSIFPQLRSTKISVEYTTKVKTNATLLKLAKSNPSILSKHELLYAGFIAEEQSLKENIYSNYTSLYPANWKAWNNLAVAQTKQGKFSSAQESLKKLLELERENSAAIINLGVLAMAENNDVLALKLFQQAEDRGANSAELDYNIGVLLIKRGEYDDALEKMYEKSFNKALAQTLAGDNDGAFSTVNSMHDCDHPYFYYLKAVIGARLNSKDYFIKNIKLAVGKDNSLKEYAKNDVEFLKYFENSEFKKIID